jgi:hypothetical protein
MKNFKEHIDRPRKIALYADLTIDDFVMTHEVNYVTYDEHYTRLPEGESREIPMEGSVRITEPVDVSFTAIDNDAIVSNAVKSLDAEELKLRAELNKKIATIRDRKNQLLALRYQPEADT